MVAPLLAVLALMASSADAWTGRRSALSNASEVDSTDLTAIFRPPTRLRNVYPATDFNRNVSTTWWQTSVLDGNKSSSTQLSTMLKEAAFVILDPEMYQLVYHSPNSEVSRVERLFKFPAAPSFAQREVHDGTVYSPECNCVYFAELHPPRDGYSADAMDWVWRADLSVNPPSVQKVFPKPQLTVPNGAYYHNGSVYWAQEGNYTVPGGIVRMDPVTLETEVVLNNWFGHRFNSPNDIVITRDGTCFFSDGYYGFDNFNDTLKPELANGVWRWEMNTGDIRQVHGAGGGFFTNPNGLALNRLENKIYVTNRGNTSDNSAGGRSIYEFELSQGAETDKYGRPSSRPVRGGELFAYVDAGFPDGIKVDKDGRVYGAVDGGVYVFNESGRFIGIIKVADGDVAVNMQFVRDWLYIVGREYMYRVRLRAQGAQVVDRDRDNRTLY